MTIIPSSYRGMLINTIDGTFVPVPAPTVETRDDALRHEVPRSDIDSALVEEIERTVRMASRTLGLDPPPRVRWLPASTKSIRGVTFDDTLTEVWVTVQPPERARDTALHELRHIWQLRGDRYKSAGLWTMEQRQRDADTFAATWSPFDQPAPVTAHPQPAGGDRHGAGGSERGRQIWEEKYAPLHEAARQYVAERQARWPRRARW